MRRDDRLIALDDSCQFVASRVDVDLFAFPVAIIFVLPHTVQRGFREGDDAKHDGEFVQECCYLIPCPGELSREVNGEVNVDGRDFPISCLVNEPVVVGEEDDSGGFVGVVLDTAVDDFRVTGVAGDDVVSSGFS